MEYVRALLGVVAVSFCTPLATYPCVFLMGTGSPGMLSVFLAALVRKRPSHHPPTVLPPVDCTSAGAHLTLALAPHPRMRAFDWCDTEGEVVFVFVFGLLVQNQFGVEVMFTC